MKGSYMKVEDVLRYMNSNKLVPLPQYKLVGSGLDCHFFKCEDVKEKIGERLFKVMECDVVQFIPDVAKPEKTETEPEEYKLGWNS
jgi:hypothetical protein